VPEHAHYCDECDDYWFHEDDANEPCEIKQWGERWDYGEERLCYEHAKPRSWTSQPSKEAK
jgi:hypothetical protein